MANWNNPTLTSTYTNFVTEVKDRDVEVALWFEGMSPTNLPTNAKRLNTSTGKFEKWNGTAWVDAASSFTFPAMVVDGNVGIGTASPASKLDIGGGTSGQRLTFSNTAGNTAARTMFEIGYKTASFTGYAAIAGISETAFDDSLGLRFYTGTGSERMRIDSSGNLGLGVTPSAWNSALRTFDFGGYGALYSSIGTDIGIANNWYYNTSGNFIYKNSSAASYYQQLSGSHRWYVAPSGTAGNAITFTQAMTLDASGNLALGATSASARLNVRAAGVTAAVLTIGGTDVDNNNIDFDLFPRQNHLSNPIARIRGVLTYGAGGSEAGDLAFFTTTGGVVTERARIDSSGNLGLGVTPSAWQGTKRAIQVSSTGSLYADGSAAIVGYNTYVNSSGSTIYLTSAAASAYAQTGGQHQWYTAPSGTAGNAISFTQAMTLDANGNLNIGSTSSSTPLRVLRAGHLTGGGWRELALLTDASGNNGVFFGFPDSTPANPVGIIGATSTGAANALAFWTWNGSAWAERARIDTSGNLVANSSVTGYWQLPNGTTAQRPTGAAGMIRFNTSLAKYEGHNGTAWSSIGGGATGGGSDDIFYENGQTVTTNYTITTNKNAMSAGPITVASGITVTVPSGSTWVVV